MNLNYLDFLKKLFALGPKLPEVYKQLAIIYTAVMALIALINPEPADAGLAAIEVSEEELALETQVLQQICAPGVDSVGTQPMLGDGTGLRAIWAFLNSPLGQALLKRIFG